MVRGNYNIYLSFFWSWYFLYKQGELIIDVPLWTPTYGLSKAG